MLFLSLLEIIKSSTIEIRIIFDRKELGMHFLEFIEKDNTLAIYHGGTRFFRIQNSIFQNNDSIESKFFIEKSKFNIQFEELMINSFAWSFSEEKLIEEKANRIKNSIQKRKFSGNLLNYSIYSRENNLILGSFSLLDLREEVQLHSVAGRPLNELINTKNKLTIIMYFVLQVMNSMYFGKAITFNSSGASQLYKDLGIDESNRYGFVIKKND